MEQFLCVLLMIYVQLIFRKKLTYSRIERAIIVLLGLFISIDSLAVTKISVANGNWSSASTWSPSGVPTSTDNIIVNTSIVLDANIRLDPGGSLTVNAGKSLIGPFVLNTNGALTGSGIAIVNYGTLTLDEIQSSEECGLVSLDNYGVLTVQGTATTVFAWKSGGTITNHAGATINVPNSMMRISNQCYTASGCSNPSSFPCNNGRPTVDNYGIMNVWDLEFHANSIGINRAGAQIVTIAGGPGIFMAAYDFDNYGCIIGNSPIDLDGKTNNNGHNHTTLHDGSKIVVPGNLFKVTSTGHVLTGVDDDGNNVNNACIWSSQNITNSGTITGELFLNDLDGAVTGGTIGANVILGTGQCGYTAAQPCGCKTPNCGTATIKLN